MDLKNGSPEISMPMPSDDQHYSTHKSSSNDNPHYKTTNTSKPSSSKRSKTKAYQNLSTILRQSEQQFEYKIILEIFLCICAVAIIVASFITLQLKQHLLLGVQAWKWILLVGAAFCGLSIIRFSTYAVLRLLIEPLFELNKYAVFFARGLKTSVDVLLWLCVVLVFWMVWFHRKIRSSGSHLTEIQHYVARTLIALVLGALFWVFKDLLLLKLESDLHLNRFYARIRYAILHVHAIQMVNKRENWSFTGIKEREKFLENVHEMEKGAPTWLLKSLANLFEKSLEEEQLPHVYNEFCDDHVLIDKAGSRLLRSVGGDPHEDRHMNNHGPSVGSAVMEGVYSQGTCSKCISLEDLKNRLQLTDKEARVLLKLLQVYDTANKQRHHDQVELKTFIIWVTHAYRTCWAMKRSLKNSRGAINQLNRLLSSFLVVVTIVIWLLLTEIATQSTIALALSPFLAATFIFGDSCKTMFQGIIFAFVMHPFEVGDRCIIAGEHMMVDRINILTTELRKSDNGESVVYPNSVLASKEISNCRAIRNQEDTLNFNIDPATPWEKMEDLKTAITKEVQENPHFSSEVEVLMENFGKVGVYFKYLVSQPGLKEKAKWKSELFSTIRKILQGLEINPAS